MFKDKFNKMQYILGEKYIICLKLILQTFQKEICHQLNMTWRVEGGPVSKKKERPSTQMERKLFTPTEEWF